MLESWSVFVRLMRVNRRFIVLSSNSVLGRPTPNALGTGGRGRHSQSNGDRVFNSWLNMRRYLLWFGLRSQPSHIRKAVAYRMSGRVTPQSRRRLMGLWMREFFPMILQSFSSRLFSYRQRMTKIHWSFTYEESRRAGHIELGFN